MSFIDQCFNAKAISEVGTIPWLHFFFYGASRNGKTTICGTFPRPLMIMPRIENSIVTLAGQDIQYLYTDGRNAPLKNGVGGLETIISMLEREYASNPQTFPFDTICLESLTHYFEQFQEELTQNNKVAMDQRGWGLLAAHMRNIQMRLRALEVHVVFTALEKLETDAAGHTLGGPQLPGKTASMLPAACEIVGYCEAGEGVKPVYRTHFRRYRHFLAGTRFPAVPPVIDNFTFDKIRPYLDGSVLAKPTK